MTALLRALRARRDFLLDRLDLAAGGIFLALAARDEVLEAQHRTQVTP